MDETAMTAPVPTAVKLLDLETPAVPAWNSAAAITNAIGQYKQQYENAVQALNTVDQQRAQLVKTIDTVIGAVAALEQLLQNQKDEAAATPQG
jgi:hypothetical protein